MLAQEAEVSPTMLQLPADPAQWSVQNVIDYFRNRAGEDFPDNDAELEEISDIWCLAIKKYKFSGRKLLKNANIEVIRELVKSSICAAAIMECIEHLKDLSQKSIDKAIPSQQERSLKRAALPIIAPLQSTTQQQTISELPVKRRKLAIVTNVPPRSSISRAIVRTGHMPTHSLKIDNIFYGTTKLGDEIDYSRVKLATTASTYIGDKEEFQFSVTHRSAAESALGARQLKRFLLNQRPVRMTRDGRLAAYLTPSPTSATVFRFDQKGHCIAVRENCYLHENGIIVTLEEAYGIQDQYTSLLFNHNEAQDAEIVDDDGSLDDDDFSDTHTVSDPSQGSDMAEEEAEGYYLSDIEIQHLVTEATERMRAAWNERLPKLETKAAGEVWKSMGRGQELRSKKIEQAKLRIAYLQARLDKLFTELPAGSIKDKAELDIYMQNMQPTIEDIFVAEWNIQVYNRRIGPDSAASIHARFAQRQQNGVRINATPQNDVMTGFIEEDEVRQASTLLNSSQQATQTVPHFVKSKPSNADAKTKPSRTPCSMKPAENEDLDIIMLSSDSSAPKSRFKTRVKHASHARATEAYTLNLNDLTSAHIKLLDADRLAKESDRLRLLLKLLHEQTSTYRNSLLASISQGRVGFRKQVYACIDAIMAGTAVADDEPIYTCTGLYLAWYFSLASISYTPQEDMAETKGDDQFKIFADQLHMFLQKKDSAMFASTAKKLTDLLSSPVTSEDDEPSTVTRTKRSRISSHFSSEDDMSDEGSSRTNKRKQTRKKKSRPLEIIKSHQDAHRRSEEFSQREMHQSRDSQIQDGIESPLIEVNLMRQEGEPPIHIDRHISPLIKQHQIEGVQFMFRELTAKDDTEIKGCLLAHSMGLGKTMQTLTVLIALTQASTASDVGIRQQLPTFLQLDPLESRRHLRVLIICPTSLTRNWENEVQQWDQGHTLGICFNFNNSKSPGQRLNLVEEWQSEGGVLLISNETFSKVIKTGKDLATRNKSIAHSRMEELYKTMAVYLVELAEVAILDEAHSIKSRKTGLNRAVTSLHARARIALTGTPLSNAIEEVFEIISWVSPGYFSSQADFHEDFVLPIKAGIVVGCDVGVHRRALRRLKILVDDLGPKCHRREIGVLRNQIPSKLEFIITVALTSAQNDVYSRLIDIIKEWVKQERNRGSILAWHDTLSLITAHPWAFKHKLESQPKKPPKAKKSTKVTNTIDDRHNDNDRMTAGLLLINAFTASYGKTGMIEEARSDLSSGASSTGDSEDDAGDLQDDQAEESVIDEIVHGFSAEECQSLLASIDDSLDPALSTKTSMLFTIMDKTLAAKDKLLVFSHHLTTIAYIQKLLLSIPLPSKGMVRFAIISGAISEAKRLQCIEEMKLNKIDVLLISTRAGGTGLNIQCANRVVIFDHHFNPTQEQQAIGRAFRIGQQKPVFVYHLIAGGTFETNMQNLGKLKTTLNDRVVDDKKYKRQAVANTEEWLHKPNQLRQGRIDEWLDKDPGVLDDVIREQMSIHATATPHIYSIVTTETLRVEVDEELLLPEELEEVREEQRIRNSARLAAKNAAKPL